jgi:DNA repair protein RadC
MEDFSHVKNPTHASHLFRHLQAEEQEVVSAAFLKTNQAVIEVREIFRGTLSESIAQPREILREALRLNAAKFIVAHNHVSGDLFPSESDLRFTVRLEWAADAIGVDLVDHLILSPSGDYFSFLESKLLKKVGRRPWQRPFSRSRGNPNRFA